MCLRIPCSLGTAGLLNCSPRIGGRRIDRLRSLDKVNSNRCHLLTVLLGLLGLRITVQLLLLHPSSSPQRHCIQLSPCSKVRLAVLPRSFCQLPPSKRRFPCLAIQANKEMRLMKPLPSTVVAVVLPALLERSVVPRRCLLRPRECWRHCPHRGLLGRRSPQMIR